MDENSKPVPKVRRAHPKYQVFISSTYEDLREERRAVTWEILKARHIPAGMENFSAAPDRGWNIIKRTIDESDYYVVLVAGKYGSIDGETGLSWTEREYRYALQRNLAIMTFVREPRAITLDQSEKASDGQEKLAAFICALKNAHHCEAWDSTADLCAKVAQALAKRIRDDEDEGQEPPGWYRGTDVPSVTALDEFSRLSSENMSLREALNSREAPKPILQIRWRGGEPLLDGLAETRERVVLNQDFLGWSPEEVEEVRKYVERLNSTVWLSLEIANSGGSPARNTVVDLQCDSSSGVIIDRLERPKSSHRAIPNLGSWHFKPEEHVYVDRHAVNGTVANVRQRVKLVGVGGTEELIRVGFVLDGTTTAESRTALLSYVARSEDGTSTNGSMRCRIDYGSSKSVDPLDLIDDE